MLTQSRFSRYLLFSPIPTWGGEYIALFLVNALYFHCKRSRNYSFNNSSKLRDPHYILWIQLGWLPPFSSNFYHYTSHALDISSVVVCFHNWKNINCQRFNSKSLVTYSWIMLSCDSLNGFIKPRSQCYTSSFSLILLLFYFCRFSSDAFL